MSKKDVDLSNITAKFSFLKIKRFRGFTASTGSIELYDLSSSSYKI